MTEQSLRSLVASTAESYLGCRMSDKSHAPIIDIYNSVKPLPRGVAITYTMPWCAAFGSAVAIKLDLADIIPQECSCNAQIALWQQMGRWCEDDAYTPQIGDYIYYDWQDSGKGDNVGEADHVGIVVSCDGKTIKVIEGNKGSASVVGYRTLKVNGRYIRGYGLPDYAAKAAAMVDDDNSDDGTGVAIILPILYKGISGYAPSVKAMQTMLAAGGYYTDAIDGSFGAHTMSALTAYQAANKLLVDGFCGKQTWTKLLKG